MSAAVRDGRGRRRLVSASCGTALLVLLVALSLTSLAPAFGMPPWHGPDAHSSRPHRGADAPLSADDLLELRRAGLSARVVEYLATSTVPPALPRTSSLYWPPPPAEVLPPLRPYWRRSPKILRR